MLSRFAAIVAGPLLSVVLVAQNTPVPRPEAIDARNIFETSRLHRLHLTISPEEWRVLQTSNAVLGPGGTARGDAGEDYKQADGRLVHVGSGFGGYFPWVHADMRVDDLVLKDIGLRYKGNLSFSSSSGNAPFRANFKAKTDLFGGKTDWNGVETLNLHAGVLDASLLREAMGMALFRAAGVPASRTAYVEITFNVPGTHENASGGLYVLIENVNKQFLKRALPPGTGLLLKPEGLRGGGILSQGDNWSSYLQTFRPDREATPREQQRVIEFAKLVSQTDVAVFREKIGTFLDVDEFLRYVAVNAFIVNWDSYLGGGHNFYLYLDPKDDKFRFIPWDLDLSMGNRGAMTFDMMRPYQGNNPLIYWLLDDPIVAERYRAIVRELASTTFSQPEMEKVLGDLERVVGSRGQSPKDFLAGRATYVQSLVADWDKPKP